MDLEHIGTALGVLSSMMGMATKVTEREFNQALIALQKELLEIQREAVALQQQNITLTNEVNELKKRQELGSTLQYDGYVYWSKGQDEYDGPFCSSCWDDRYKLIRLTHIPGNFSGKYRYECHAHKGTVHVPRSIVANYRNPRLIPEATNDITI